MIEDPGSRGRNAFTAVDLRHGSNTVVYLSNPIKVQWYPGNGA